MGVDGAAIPGLFIAIFVLMTVAGIGSWLYRISVARRMAEDAGLDPDQAARVAMLSKDGVEATYLAATLAQRPRTAPPAAPPPAAPPQAAPPLGAAPTAPVPAQPAPPPRPKTAEERLRELQSLRDQGLITDEEFQAQRRKILGSI